MLYEFILLLLGCLYPAFATYNSLDANQQQLQIIWLKYWIIFGCAVALHLMTTWLENWVPFLSSFKLFVVCWLLPNLGGGSLLLHDKFVEPFMQRNIKVMNEVLTGVTLVSSAIMRELIKTMYQLLVDVFEQCWLLTRNSEELCVTPRLQASINDVIAELREARHAMDVKPKEDSFLDLDDMALRILHAEAKSAQRMHLSWQSANQEYLAPINSCVGLVQSKQQQMLPQPFVELEQILSSHT
ncbi:putative HVA22-like protein g [Drosophila busckii]|uniref:putative HVA22-like protein g n=1 Tax=Drosophila busckii TaxID=30019 RepID=UPI00083EB8EB|nr:putative HVA22-like protein g [Drosophila busckii]